MATAGAHPASQLVACGLSRGLPTLEGRTEPASAGLQRELSKRARRFEGADWVGIAEKKGGSGPRAYCRAPPASGLVAGAAYVFSGLNGYLTPHPGPLPVEGRGGATDEGDRTK